MKKIIILIFICLLSLNCKRNNKKNTVQVQNKKEYVQLQRDTYNGQWICYKYEKDTRFKQEFSEEYAQQYVEYVSFILKKDSLIIPNTCSKYVYDYKYPTKLNKYEEESVFITFFNPKNDSITFIRGIEIDWECNDMFKVLYLDKNEIITNKGGYFFYFKKLTDKKKSKNIKSIILNDDISSSGDEYVQTLPNEPLKNITLPFQYKKFIQDFFDNYETLNVLYPNYSPKENFIFFLESNGYQSEEYKCFIIPTSKVKTYLVELLRGDNQRCLVITTDNNGVITYKEVGGNIDDVFYDFTINPDLTITTNDEKYQIQENGKIVKIE